MITRRGPAAVLLAALALAGAAGGCSVSVHVGGSSISKGDLEQKVVDTLTPDFDGEGVTVGAATCPGSLRLEVGQKASCTLLIDDVMLPLDVSITSVMGKDATFDIVRTKALLSLAKIESTIQDKVTAGGTSGSTVDCRTGNGGGAILLAAVGSTFECSAVAGGDTGRFVVTVKDVQGNVDFQGSDD